jgi:hypothetical protein
MNSRICNPKDPCMLHAICLMYSEHREEGSISSLLLILIVAIPLALRHRRLLLIRLHLRLTLLLLFPSLLLLGSLSSNAFHASFSLQVDLLHAIFVGTVGLVCRTVRLLPGGSLLGSPAVSLTFVVLRAMVSGAHIGDWRRNVQGR